ILLSLVTGGGGRRTGVSSTFALDDFGFFNLISGLRSVPITPATVPCGLAGVSRTVPGRATIVGGALAAAALAAADFFPEPASLDVAGAAADGVGFALTALPVVDGFWAVTNTFGDRTLGATTLDTLALVAATLGATTFDTVFLETVFLGTVFLGTVFFGAMVLDVVPLGANPLDNGAFATGFAGCFSFDFETVFTTIGDFVAARCGLRAGLVITVGLVPVFFATRMPNPF
ncbi:MAG: hypothetical protein H7Y43_10485, partial [Akkermansiaceae bacterium]|nr:hypothetical protein [Verrucomicrobiales bacterium]